MNKLQLLLIPALLLSLFSIGSAFPVLHPYHVSLTEMERNARSGNFEVAMCVWPADLEKALSQMTDTVVDLDTAENLDEMIVAYLKKRVAFRNGDEVANIRFVGHEINLKKGWLYFEVQTGESDGWSIENRVFFELNEDQANHLNFKSESGIRSFVCTRADDTFESAAN